MGSRNRTARGLVLAMLLALGGCSTLLGPTQPDSNWHTYESPRFTLFVRPASFAEQNAAQIAAMLDDQYTVTVAALDLRYAGRVAGFLYNSGADADLESDFSGSGYADNETFRAVCVPPLGANLFGLLSHEANHVIQIAALGRPGTSFVTEGLASAVLSERYYPYGRTLLYQWTASNTAQIPPLAGLADDEKWPDSPQRVAYNASASFLAYLLETAGPTRLKQLYYVPSKDFGRRFQEIYGRSLEDAEHRWKEFCAQPLR